MKQVILMICLLAIMILTIGYYREKAIKSQKQNEIYQQNNTTLLNKLRRVYDEKIQLEEQNLELEKRAKEDKTFFDWNADISNSAVIRQLRQNAMHQ